MMVFVTMFGRGIPQTCQWTGSVGSQFSARPKDGRLEVTGTHRGGGKRVMCDFPSLGSGVPYSKLKKIDLSAPSNTLHDLW
jgi:hypothetical protein